MSTSNPLDPEKRGRLEPHRMSSTELKLRSLGCSVKPGPDGFKSFTVVFPNGKRFNFWPYSGWFAGKPSGRGFENLLEAGGINISPIAGRTDSPAGSGRNAPGQSSEGKAEQKRTPGEPRIGGSATHLLRRLDGGAKGPKPLKDP